MKRGTNGPTRLADGNQSEVEDRIRRRAFELYEQRGRGDGSELTDWVQAEEEVLSSEDRARAA